MHMNVDINLKSWEILQGYTKDPVDNVVDDKGKCTTKKGDTKAVQVDRPIVVTYRQLRPIDS